MSVTENKVNTEQYKIKTKPYYEPVGDEFVEVAEEEDVEER